MKLFAKPFLAALLMSALFFSALAQADSSCSDLELDAPGGSFSNVPVINQGDEGMCQYAMLSQLIDAYRFSRGEKGENASFLTSPEYLWNLHLAHAAETGFMAILPDIESDGICSKSTCLKNELHPMHLPALEAQSSNIDIWTSDWSQLGKSDREARLAFTNSALMQNKGVGIAIKSCIFYTPTPLTPACTPTDQCDHVVIIIGRRTDPATGKCQFKLRNSWGEDCTSGQGDEALSLLSHPCDKGNFWIDADEVMKDSRSPFTF